MTRFIVELFLYIIGHITPVPPIVIITLEDGLIRYRLYCCYNMESLEDMFFCRFY